MIIYISSNELELEYRYSWKMGHIQNPHIDFATNCVHATFENRDVILFNFKKWGYVVSNQNGTHTISAGEAGIIINFYQT